MIRRGRPQDLQTVIELGNRLCDRTPYARIERDRQAIAQTISNCMASQFGCCFVAEHYGVVTGAIVGIAQQYWFSRKRQAIDLMFASIHGDGMGLARAFIDWGWSVPGVVEIALAQSSGIEVERTAKLYEFLGFAQVGGVFSMTQRPAAAQRRSA